MCIPRLKENVLKKNNMAYSEQEKARRRAFYHNHKHLPEFQERAKLAREKYKDKRKAKGKEYYLANKEQIAESAKQYVIRHSNG